MRVVAGGGGWGRDAAIEKAEQAFEQRVRAEVSQHFKGRLEGAGRWRRFILRCLMEWEIQRRLAERLFGGH